MTVAAEAVAGSGRANQRLRTRKDLLQAAARLLKEGRRPSIDEVAEAALVSRATAYRYFPNVEDLLVEAAVDVEFPDPETLFAGAARGAVERLHRADAALEAMIEANEAALRTVISHATRLAHAGDGRTSVRQNRRTPLIEAAVEPERAHIDPAAYDNLVKALALVLGTESMLVFKDVLGTDAKTARRVRRWAIEALVAAARKPSA